jgi:hypothetical protein
MNHKDILRGIVICMIVLFVAVCIILVTPVGAYDGGRITTARQDALHEAADLLRAAGLPDSDPAIMVLSAEWWAEQEALDIVARVVQGEAGACPWMHQVAVAAVVVNRVKSPYFPDTVRDVVAAPGQYTTLYLSGFDKTSRQCYEAAKKALDGDSGVPEDVIWQAEFVQGTEVWWRSEVDTGWYQSVTYFCRGIPGVS